MKISLDYLIPELRLKIGDISSPYRYLDEWLELSLSLAVRSLQRFWKSKYLVDDDFRVYRNSNTPEMFIEEEKEGSVVEQRDEPIIVIMASIIVLEGSLENSAWSTGSWRDAEIAYSNIEQGKIKREVLVKLKEELDSYLLPPTRKLSGGIARRLQGYINYPEEFGDNIKTQ